MKKTMGMISVKKEARIIASDPDLRRLFLGPAQYLKEKTKRYDKKYGLHIASRVAHLLFRDYLKNGEVIK